MKLDHLIIDSVEKWKQFAPPFGGDKQWEDGRSAKELAKYIIGANGIPTPTAGAKSYTVPRRGRLFRW